MTDIKSLLLPFSHFETMRYSILNILQIYGVELLEEFALRNSSLFDIILKNSNENQLLKQGKLRAHLAAWRAWEKVPAYKDFLNKHNYKELKAPLEQLPITSKESYIRAYPIEKRCVGGTYLHPGVAIDESSGSTGTPYNWVRGEKERQRIHRTLARMIEWTYGKGNRIAINAFSMGAWATGINLAESLELHCVVKSTGPDLEKILNTLEFFGPSQGYFICGYPPFIKLILDSMIDRNFPIEQYELHALVGGEAISEELRSYLLKYFKTCVSAYGASDLEMGIAVETTESIYIRGLLYNNKDIRKAILGDDHRIPMIFQYNPLTHYIEVNDQNELIITLNYSQILSPRIRYNIGDEGFIIKRQELLKKLQDLGYLPQIKKNQTLPFPYLFLFGRSDQTISIMGANIYSDDVCRAIYSQKELMNGCSSFNILLKDKNDGSISPHLYIEWNSDTPPQLHTASISKRIVHDLSRLNSDFRNALHEYPGALDFHLEIHGFGKGPFSQRRSKIKNCYIGGQNCNQASI